MLYRQIFIDKQSIWSQTDTTTAGQEHPPAPRQQVGQRPPVCLYLLISINSSYQHLSLSPTQLQILYCLFSGMICQTLLSAPLPVLQVNDPLRRPSTVIKEQSHSLVKSRTLIQGDMAGQNNPFRVSRQQLTSNKGVDSLESEFCSQFSFYPFSPPLPLLWNLRHTRGSAA